MKAEHVEILLEEPSAEAALEVLLPRILGLTTFAIHVHQGKDDLLAKLPAKLKAYKKWLPHSFRILVLIERPRELACSRSSFARRSDNIVTCESLTSPSFELGGDLANGFSTLPFFGNQQRLRQRRLDHIGQLVGPRTIPSQRLARSRT